MLRLPTTESEESMSSCTFWLNGLTSAVLTLCAIGAQAAPVTMKLDTQIGGDYYNVVRSGTPDKYYSGTGGGGYSGTLTDASLLHDQHPLLAYCVDLDHTFSLGQSYTTYSIVTADWYLNSTKAGWLSNLFTWAVADSSSWFSDKHKSSGMQLAVWEIVYDTDLDLNGSTGFHVKSAGGTDLNALGYANTLLTHAGTSQANALNIFVLDAPNNQDQLFWEDANGKQITSSVPEPMSLALTAVALAGLALTRRRS